MKKYVIYDKEKNLYIQSLFFLTYSNFVTPEISLSSFDRALVFNESFLEEFIYVDTSMKELSAVKKLELLKNNNPNLSLIEVRVEKMRQEF